MSQYPNVRCYLAGHVHVASVTNPLTFHYDASLGSDAAENLDLNDRRFKVDTTNGLVQITPSTMGGTRLDVSSGSMTETSTISGHETETRFAWAMGYDSASDAVQVHGTGLIDSAETWSVVVMNVSSTTFTADIVGKNGDTFYRHTKTI